MVFLPSDTASDRDVPVRWEEKQNERRGKRGEREGGHLLVKARSDRPRSQVGSSHGEAPLLGWGPAAGFPGERVEPGGGLGQPVSDVWRIFFKLH